MRSCGWAIAILLQFLHVTVLAEPLLADDRPLAEVIDAQIAAAWTRENVTPAATSDDAMFQRRMSLDLIGTIPTADEARAFLDDTDIEKRTKLIDRLLADPRFAQHQAEIWDQVLFGRHPPGYGTNERDGFQDWLKRQFAENVPYNVWVKEILRGRGNTVDDGPPMYFLQYRNQPEDATESVTQTFLGVQLQCARCHDHPYEDWTQLDFYGTAAFFARLQVVEVGKQDRLTKYVVAEKNTGDVLFTGPVSEAEPGKKGEPVKPKFLHGDAVAEPELPEGFEEPRNFPNGTVPPEPMFSRRDQFANWATAKENPYFARAIANRIWAQFMGRGLVHPVDNMSESNVPSHPELLDALAAGMLEHDFDLKWYIRELVRSQTYQLSSNGSNTEARPRWFEQARTRPLSAEELLDSWKTAIRYDELVKASGKEPSKDRYDPLGSGYLMSFFGEPDNGVGDFQGGLSEHLYLNNGGMSRLMTNQKGSLADAIIESQAPWEERVEQMFLSVLSRRPSAAETAKFVEYIKADEQRPHELVQEAIWVLMSCSEFRFNH